MKINDWKCLFLFSPLNTNELIKYRSFPPHMAIFSHSSFSFLPFYHFSHEDVLKLTDEQKGGGRGGGRQPQKIKKIAQTLNVILFHSKTKRNKGKSSGEKRTLNHLVHLLLGLQDNSSWKPQLDYIPSYVVLSFICPNYIYYICYASHVLFAPCYFEGGRKGKSISSKSDV